MTPQSGIASTSSPLSHMHLCLGVCFIFVARPAGAGVIVRAVDTGKFAVPVAACCAVEKRDLERRRLVRLSGGRVVRAVVVVTVAKRRRRR